MVKEVKTLTCETITFNEDDLAEILKAKEDFISDYAVAKKKIKNNENDYDAKVDVCFYKLLIKKVNNIIYQIKKKGYYRDDTKRKVNIVKSVEPFFKSNLSIRFKKEEE